MYQMQKINQDLKAVIKNEGKEVKNLHLKIGDLSQETANLKKMKEVKQRL